MIENFIAIILGIALLVWSADRFVLGAAVLGSVYLAVFYAVGLVYFWNAIRAWRQLFPARRS